MFAQKHDLACDRWMVTAHVQIMYKLIEHKQKKKSEYVCMIILHPVDLDQGVIYEGRGRRSLIEDTAEVSDEWSQVP